MSRLIQIGRYVYGWQCFFRTLRMARAKKHGAGKQTWENAIKSAACYRYIVDGQFKTPPRVPRWMRGLGRL